MSVGTNPPPGGRDRAEQVGRQHADDRKHEAHDDGRIMRSSATWAASCQRCAAARRCSRAPADPPQAVRTGDRHCGEYSDLAQRVEGPEIDQMTLTTLVPPPSG